MRLSVLILFFICLQAFAGVDGSISGIVTDIDGIAVAGAHVVLQGADGKTLKEVQTGESGNFSFFPLTFGEYKVAADKVGSGIASSSTHVASGGNSEVDLQLAAKTKEIVMEVKEKRRLVQHSASVTSREVNKEDIAQMPQGEDVSLPKLLTSTTPGTVQGPFGQVFFRGNHANIQYQIDGVQLPDSPSNTFGEAFSPRNIDHMEVITGGIPAEYGERLAAVVNIVTKSGTEEPKGEAEVNYGSYNTFAPHGSFSGSNKEGNVHYFATAAYLTTDRGLDTPQPSNTFTQGQGGKDAVHDQAQGHNEFVKVDWFADNENKLSLVLFDAQNRNQIPNYPGSFPTSGFVDQFDPTTTFNYVPYNTDDWQKEINAYVQTVWKHTVSDHAFFQLAPYYKYSSIFVQNDPTNDLSSQAGSSPSSFYENRKVNNLGLKGDYSNRLDDKNLLKFGFQAQTSKSTGSISVQTSLTSSATGDSSVQTGSFESLYASNDYTISKTLTLNTGLRFDATQFSFDGLNPNDNALQPRIGLNWMVTPSTKVHGFYGRLFQPAPVENLRDTFLNTQNGTCAAGTLCPYDIKAEKDDYWEVGVAQELADSHVIELNTYYKNARNMLDDAQLLNTSIAQPYNFNHGYAYGIETSIRGKLGDHWSDFINDTFEIAKGSGISGGIFAFASGQAPTDSYQFLDHVQKHTMTGGLNWSENHLSVGTQALFGSGLRTGPNNSLSLPSHFSMDLTASYDFHGDAWFEKWKLSGDILNIFDNAYPITIANGFNGSHYAAGREFFLRLTKEL